ncbi:unnamed protein product [Orchesella dallaii]|uniref:Odorant receptor n=1 Tax=Orchesella dallaii TaxID=48710 RepID=A0ABP1Q3N2_9HEXA
MSSLALHSFELHQKAVDLFIPHCFYWDIEKKVWKYESNFRKLRPYYVLNFGIIGFMGFQFALFLIGVSLIDPELFKLKQVLMVILMFVGGNIVLLEDILMYFYGKELLSVANWCSSINESEFVGENAMKEFSLKNAIAEEIGKLRKGERFDFYGIFMNYVVVTYIFLGTVTPLLAVYEDWDPFHLFLLAVDSPKILGGFHLHLASNPFLKGIRFLSTSILMQSAFMSTRGFTLIILSFAQTIIKVFSHLIEQRVSHIHIRRYREFLLCFRLTDEPLRLLFGGFLLLGFIILVLSVSITFFGWKFLPWNVYIFLPLLTLIVASFIILPFKVSCFLYETSQSILKRWKCQARIIIFGVRLYKTLQSLRPLYLPVGNVGKMDDVKRMTYFESLMYYIMNFLIAFRDKLQ